MHFKIWQSSFNLPIDLNEISHHMHDFDKIIDSLLCVLTPSLSFLQEFSSGVLCELILLHDNPNINVQTTCMYEP
jgi:hypothetical protein